MTPFPLKQRMYGLVPYNISPIQQGIQFGHAVVEYGLTQTQQDPTDTELSPYNQWAHLDKTFIILNGGTTNSSRMALDNYGTLNKALDELKKDGIEVATFYEPDLGDQLTAVVFLVDERVWDKENYPDAMEFWHSAETDHATMTLQDNFMKAHGKGEWTKVAKMQDFLSKFKLA
jgi:hypothetical protein